MEPDVSNMVVEDEFILDGNITYVDLMPTNQLQPTDIEYKPEWEAFPEFRLWLRPVVGDTGKAWCRACEKIFKADLKSLRVHGAGKFHLNLVQSKYGREIVEKSPAVGYSIITDRKGSYGIGIVSKVEDAEVTSISHSLYVNPTNPNTNILAKEPKKDSESYVVVPVPTSGSSIESTKTVEKDDVVIRHFELPKQPSKSETGEDGEVCEDVFKRPRKKLKSMDEIADVRSCKPLCPALLATISRLAPYWEGDALINGEIKRLRSTDYLGKYLILFFYVRDFSRLCPNEIMTLNNKISEFSAVNAEIVACSVDSCLVHRAWWKLTRANKESDDFLKIPLLSDSTHVISERYGCYLPEEGRASRAHFIIDEHGILRHITITDDHIGRNSSDMLRLIKGFQHSESEEVYIPVKWNSPGDTTIAQ